MKTYHHTGTGARHEGHEFDCPGCRAALLESFRPSPEVPEQARQRSLPHLSVPADSARTVDLGRYSEPFAETDAAHITEHGTDPDPDQPGGDWFVRCSCGWSETGHYARDGVGERTATRLAGIKAQKHRENPEDGQ